MKLAPFLQIVAYVGLLYAEAAVAANGTTMVSSQAVRAYLDHKLDPSQYDLNADLGQSDIEQQIHKGILDDEMAAFERKMGGKASAYPLEKVRKYFGIKPSAPASGFSAKVMVRGSYDDVLPGEDPTASAFKGGASGGGIGAGGSSGASQTKPATTKTDLTGALFSYGRDLIKNKDIWTAKGALILRLEWDNPTPPNASEQVLYSQGLIPSISFNRVQNSADKTKDVDQLIFRAGAFADFAGGNVVDQLEIRAFASYGTDFNFEEDVPAGELEIEPIKLQLSTDPRSIFSKMGVGSIHELAHDEQDKPILAYILRTYLHFEGGSISNVNNSAATALPPEYLGTFFRLGPDIQLTLDPLFLKQLSCTVSYEYLFDCVGSSQRPFHFKLDPEWALDKDKTVSLKVSYEHGGLDLTKKRVDTFLLGLGIKY
jgi:hypothetical protein